MTIGSALQSKEVYTFLAERGRTLVAGECEVSLVFKSTEGVFRTLSRMLAFQAALFKEGVVVL